MPRYYTPYILGMSLTVRYIALPKHKQVQYSKENRLVQYDCCVLAPWNNFPGHVVA